jgi:hypothetical protein
VPVAHACNPSYLGGRDQEDHGSKPAQANSLQDPTSKKNPSQKWAGGVTRGVGPEFKPQCHKRERETSFPILYLIRGPQNSYHDLQLLEPKTLNVLKF